MRRNWTAIIARAAELATVETNTHGVAPTLRRLHYLLVSDAEAVELGYINIQTCYQQLSDKTTPLRRAGTFPALLDRTRTVELAVGYTSPQGLLASVARSFTLNRADRLDPRIVILSEKDGVIPVLQTRYSWLDMSAIRGYSSESHIRRLNDLARRGDTVGLYLGDYDPTGLDISRDLAVKLSFPVRRVLLNHVQVVEYELPPMMAKKGDSRAKRMIETEGSAMQVELDALPTGVLLDLVGDAITNETGVELGEDGWPDWPEVDAEEADIRTRLLAVAEGWE